MLEEICLIKNARLIHEWTIVYITGILFAFIGVVAIYIAVSHDYPKMFANCRQQIAWIALGQLSVWLSCYSIKISLANHAILICVRIGIDGATTYFYSSELVINRSKTG